MFLKQLFFLTFTCFSFTVRTTRINHNKSKGLKNTQKNSAIDLSFFLMPGKFHTALSNINEEI